jgi:hypothetical protein
MTVPLHTRPGPQDVYTGRTTNWPMVLAETALVVPLIGFSLTSRSDSTVAVAVPYAVVAVLLLVNVLTATNVRTTVGPNGVAVRFGVVGWPRATYALDDIRSAEVIDLPWWAVVFGFWWTPRRTCFTVRSGPTLRLTLGSGRTVTISVPGPDAAVATLARARVP